MAQLASSSSTEEAIDTLARYSSVRRDDRVNPHLIYYRYMGRQLSPAILGVYKITRTTLIQYYMGILEDYG